MTAHEEMHLAHQQPRLWIDSMLEEYDRLRSASAKEAVLARVGVVLFSLFGIQPFPQEFVWGSKEEGNES